MSTESIDTRFTDLDDRPLGDIMSAIWQSQHEAMSAVRDALPQITHATESAAKALGSTGRLIYAGAGTSIRVAVQDGSELPPTFNWPLSRIRFVIAGGERALIESQEGAEDSKEDAVYQLEQLVLTPNDVVLGVAASGSTPFTVAAIEYARSKDALTIGIANNPNTGLLESAACPILMQTGSELIAGSTRMKAGTTQKVVLNMISTGIMMQLGRVYQGLMVDMRVSNQKLAIRAVKMIATITGCDPLTAGIALKKADGSIKIASLVALGCDAKNAIDILGSCNNNLREAMGFLESQKVFLRSVNNS